MNDYAPIAVFAYNRLDSLQQTISSLKNCHLADECEVHVFSDGFKGEKDREDVLKVRDYIKTINGFSSLHFHFSEVNKGLANSIISGASEVIGASRKIIVLEDDLIVSRNFLLYMNQALNKYKNNPQVFSISGYSIPVTAPKNYSSDIYFFPRASSWGWATWSDRWENVDWEAREYENFKKNRQQIKRFNRGGSDMFKMLTRQMNGEINSWAIRWCFHQFRIGAYTAYPVLSKVINIGFTDQATHSNVFNRYKTELDDGARTSFNFPERISFDESFIRQFQSFYGVKARIINRVKTGLYKAGFLKNGASA